MPTYEYACKACEHRFEIVQSFSEDALTTCPDCGREQLRKVYNAAGIIFKGDGWHIKDYAAKKTSGTSTAGSAGEAKDGGSEGGTTKPKKAKKGEGGSDAAAKPAAS